MEVLSGRVDSRELLHRLSEQRFWGVHLASHGDARSFLLSDGPFNFDLLVNLWRERPQVRPTLVFFNACQSLPLAAQAFQAGVDYCIGWPQEVSDQAAAEFAQTFYNALRYGGEVHGAFTTAQLMLGRFYAGILPPILLNGRVDRLQRRLKELERELHERPAPFFRSSVLLSLLSALLGSLLGAGLTLLSLNLLHLLKL